MGAKPAPAPESGRTPPVAPQNALTKAPAAPLPAPGLKDPAAGRAAEGGERETPATDDKNTKDQSGRKQAKTAPLLLLSPDGDSGNGPMRLVISGDSVAIVQR